MELGFCANNAAEKHSKKRVLKTLVIVVVGLPY